MPEELHEFSKARRRKTFMRKFKTSILRHIAGAAL
jgi:hypothetical protein